MNTMKFSLSALAVQKVEQKEIFLVYDGRLLRLMISRFVRFYRENSRKQESKGKGITWHLFKFLANGQWMVLLLKIQDLFVTSQRQAFLYLKQVLAMQETNSINLKLILLSA